ncbi:MAG: energy transducer TonB, partial [Phenylobacterium sp.]|nr:energy transducer TonB [Phenylobacterium sp.]
MRRPSPAILGSIALHAGVVALAFVSFSHKADEPKPLVNSVPVTIVSETVIEAAAADNPQPEPSPDDAATAPVSAPEEPTPPAPQPTPPPPTPTPAPPRPT